MKLTRFLAVTGILALVLLGPVHEARAVAVTYNVQAEENAYHYGCNAYIPVGYYPAVSIQKVKSIWTAKTDLTGWCEIGLTYDSYGVQPWAFVAWGEYNLYSDAEIAQAAWNSTPRFHVGYSTADQRHYFWYNNDMLGLSIPKSSVAEMTSCWPRTNAEADFNSGSGYDNDASFTSLKYKESTWGVWTAWGTSGRNYFDNDPNNSNHIGNSTVTVY